MPFRPNHVLSESFTDCAPSITRADMDFEVSKTHSRWAVRLGDKHREVRSIYGNPMVRSEAISRCEDARDGAEFGRSVALNLFGRFEGPNLYPGLKLRWVQEERQYCEFNYPEVPPCTCERPLPPCPPQPPGPVDPPPAPPPVPPPPAPEPPRDPAKPPPPGVSPEPKGTKESLVAIEEPIPDPEGSGPDKPPPVRASRIADQVVLIQRRLDEQTKMKEEALANVSSDFLKGLSTATVTAVATVAAKLGEKAKVGRWGKAKATKAAKTLKGAESADAAEASGATDTSKQTRLPEPGSEELNAPSCGNEASSEQKAVSRIDEICAPASKIAAQQWQQDRQQQQEQQQEEKQREAETCRSELSLAEKWGMKVEEKPQQRESRAAPVPITEVSHHRSGYRPAIFLSASHLHNRRVECPHPAGPSSLQDKNFRTTASAWKYSWRDGT